MYRGKAEVRCAQWGMRIVVGMVLALFLGAGAWANETVSYWASAAAADVPDYSWTYGCSPTAAGMMMGYYDINGYNGLSYNDLVPGGAAELSTFGSGSYLVNDIIASPGHIADFYSGGYGASGDDSAGPLHTFDSLADFMGTSQDSIGNTNGATRFYYYSDGSALTYTDAEALGLAAVSGMYGIAEYLWYRGYEVASLYSEYIDTMGRTYGFTWDDYVAEIDAGRVVMIQVDGHSMLGYGYGENDSVLLYDTWSESDSHTMQWGGSYMGLSQYGVTVLEIAGGSTSPPDGSGGDGTDSGGQNLGFEGIPAPGAFLLGLMGVAILGVGRRMWRRG